MAVSHLDYYLQSINESHVLALINREESNYKTTSTYPFNILCMTQIENELFITELFETRKSFMFHYLSENEHAMSINWIYNKIELLTHFVQCLNMYYRRERIRFFVTNNQIVLRQHLLDTVLSQKDVLQFYLNKVYREKLVEITEETLERLREQILK